MWTILLFSLLLVLGIAIIAFLFVAAILMLINWLSW